MKVETADHKIIATVKKEAGIAEGKEIAFNFGKIKLIVTALTDKLLHLRYSSTGEFLPRRPWAVAKDDHEYNAVLLSVQEESDFIELATLDLRLRVRRTDGGVELFTKDGQTLLQDAPEQGPLWRADNSLTSLKVLAPDQHFYGFGERTSLLEKRGRRYSCWNIDPGEASLDHGPGADHLHQSIPFFMCLQPEKGGFGLFLNNTFKTVFDVGYTSPERLAMEANGGELDYYLIFGPEPAAIVEAYTGLTGRTPLPPRWALGYHQSRWGYYPEARVREVVSSFRERSIPLEVIHLDIDYMDGYRVFTWDKNHFPEPHELISDLKKQGVRVVTIIDVGVKNDPQNGYKVYDEGIEKDYFMRQPNGELFTGFVWPGESLFPDFARADVRTWWGGLHKELLDLGVAGIWNDMNEPAINSVPFGSPGGRMIEIPADSLHGSDGEKIDHAEFHNLYGLLENQGTYEGFLQAQPDTRPFILTRAGYAGVQRWAAVWTGDNTAYWEHLEVSMPQLSNMGLSGVSFVGPDIGGYYGPSNAELWARWIELGAFYPFSRGHSVTTAPLKEPWMWGDETERIARKYLELRYCLLPYIYTLFQESSCVGSPIMRPLLYEFYQDPKVMRISDEVMLGNILLLAPIYRPGVEYRSVYLPGELWYDFWTAAPITEMNILAYAPLDVLPIYARGGTILPIGPLMQYSNEQPIDPLTLKIYLDKEGSATGRLYEDDGESFGYEKGESCLTLYTVSKDENAHFHITAYRTGRYQPTPRKIEIQVISSTGVVLHTLPEDKGNWEVIL